MKYRVDGRKKLISFGQYPDVPLKAARERRVGGSVPLMPNGVVMRRQDTALVGRDPNVTRKHASGWTA